MAGGYGGWEMGFGCDGCGAKTNEVVWRVVLEVVDIYENDFGARIPFAPAMCSLYTCDAWLSILNSKPKLEVQQYYHT